MFSGLFLTFNLNSLSFSIIMKELLLLILSALFFPFIANFQIIQVNAIDLKLKKIPGFVSFYKDNDRKALAINSIEFPNRWAATEFIFNENSGKYYFSYVN
jgi:hypothetical protein